MTARCGRYFSRLGEFTMIRIRTMCAMSEIQNASRLRDLESSSRAWISRVGKSCISRYADSQFWESKRSPCSGSRSVGGSNGIWISDIEGYHLGCWSCFFILSLFSPLPRVLMVQVVTAETYPQAYLKGRV